MSLDILEPCKSLLVSVALNRTQMTCIHEPGCKHSCWMLLVFVYTANKCALASSWGSRRSFCSSNTSSTRFCSSPAERHPDFLQNPTRPKRLFLVNLELVMTSRAVVRNETTCTNQTSKILDKLLHHRVERERETSAAAS